MPQVSLPLDIFVAMIVNTVDYNCGRNIATESTVSSTVLLPLLSFPYLSSTAPSPYSYCLPLHSSFYFALFLSQDCRIPHSC